MYSSQDILNAMDDGTISISDFDKTLLGPNSYDLRLGSYFFQVIWDNDGPWFVGPIVATSGQRINIPIGGTLLGMSKAVIGTFGNVMGKLYARSTLGRSGITICRDAGLGDIGYHNHWTLEMSAHIMQGQPFVHENDRVAQIVFFETKTQPVNPYGGQYNETNWPLCMVPGEWRHRIIAA